MLFRTKRPKLGAMSEIGSFRAVIGLWPSAEAMAAEIGAGPFAARKWATRNRIPDDWWSAVLASPTAQAAGVTADLLVELAARIPVSEPVEARA